MPLGSLTSFVLRASLVICAHVRHRWSALPAGVAVHSIAIAAANAWVNAIVN